VKLRKIEVKKHRKHKGFAITIAITFRAKIGERDEKWKINGKQMMSEKDEMKIIS